jgi:hypothetical protein
MGGVRSGQSLLSFLRSRIAARSGMIGDDFRNSRRWIVRLAMIACALAVSACSQSSALEPRPDPASASAAASANPDPQTCRPDHALLVPQPAPDCGFGRADLRTVDPDQWSRLKLDYELKCYREEEKIARARLRLLQAVVKCEVLPTR